MRTFESMFDYTWQAICQEDCKYNLRVQVDSCGILLEYSLMNAHEGTSVTRVLTQNIPASIFRARSFAYTRRAKHG